MRRRAVRKIIDTLFVMMMLFVVIAVFVSPLGVNWVKALGSYPIGVKIIIAVLALALVALRVWLLEKTRHIKIKTKKYNKALNVVCAIVTLALCVFVAYKLMPEPYNTFDSSQIYGLVHRASNGSPMDNEAYFSRHPHNLGIVLFYLSFVRLGVLIGLNNPQILMPVITILSVALTILLTVYVAEKIRKGSAARVWIMAIITPLILYSAEMYTDSISGLFIALEVFVMLKARACDAKKESVLLYVILAAVAGIGAIIKITTFIPIIAMCICGLAEKKRAKLNRNAVLGAWGAVVACIALFSSIFIGYKAIEKNILPDAETKALPYTHWVMMGMGGDGLFSSEDLEASASNAPNTVEYNLRTIKERLGKMGPFGYIGLLARKTSLTWGDGTYEVSRVVGTQPRKPESLGIQIVGVYGRYFNYYRFTTTVLQLSWLLSILAMAIFTKKKNSMISIFKLSLIGIFVFLLIWETNSRYLVNFLPILIVLQDYSVGALWKKVDMVISKKKASKA